VGSVFLLGVVTLVLGAALMLVMRRRSPAFFAGRVLTRDTRALVVEDWPGRRRAPGITATPLSERHPL
jgi:hypothetical protein